MFRLFIVLFAWKCVLICLEPFFLDLKGATATRVGKEFKRVISRCFRGFHWSIFWERSQRLPKCFVSEKRNVKSTVDLLALKIFDSVQEWTFLDPDWLAASSHIILYPFMIRIPVRSRANLMDFAPLFFPYLQSFVSCGELFITKLHPWKADGFLNWQDVGFRCLCVWRWHSSKKPFLP